jgi:HK97 family phage major capsid protein
MKLKENDQLINGTGIGNEVAGIKTYATEFVTTGIQIANANFIDLMGKIKTQIAIDMLGGASPNAAIAYNTDLDEIRYKKDTLGRYLFEAWALGNADVKIGGMTIVENPLVAENTLLAGDFKLATLYVWDDLVIEMGRTEDDMLKGLVTITAYIRENLRVKDVDKKAIVKVTDLAQTISDISIPQA